MAKTAKAILTLAIMALAPATPLMAQHNNTPLQLSKAQNSVKNSTDIITIGMATATLGGVIISKDWEGLKQSALTVATTLGTTYLLKYTVRKERPDHADLHSFPSNHSAFAFANASFLTRRYGWQLGVPAFALASYVGWGRVYAKRHYWLDVAAGAAIGMGAALIFTHPFAEKHNLAITPYSDGSKFLLSASMTL